MIWVGLDFWAGASSAYSFFGALLALCIGSPCAPSGRCLLFGSAAAAVAHCGAGGRPPTVLLIINFLIDFHYWNVFNVSYRV